MLKIKAIKIFFLEIGPFELDWPPRIKGTRLIAVSGVATATLAAFAAAIYVITVKPALDKAREDMRRGDYVQAEDSIKAVPKWAKSFPVVAGISAQASFGAAMAKGKILRDLSPELETLRSRYPKAPDVLVFEGLNAFYVDRNPEDALKLFKQAADLDAAHVEAHFLAAGRDVDLAYLALNEGAESRARMAVTDARRLIERAIRRAPYAEALPNYANQISALYALEGDPTTAFDGYNRLAPTHPLSALQAAFISWQLPRVGKALKLGREAAEVASGLINQQQPAAIQAEGWSFRVSATELIDVHSKNEKACLLEWAIDISTSLQRTMEHGTPSDHSLSGTRGAAASTESCGSGAIAGRIREIVCVQILNAKESIPPSDERQTDLDSWRTIGLQCDQDLQPLPVLSPGAAPQSTQNGTNYTPAYLGSLFNAGRIKFFEAHPLQTTENGERPH